MLESRAITAKQAINETLNTQQCEAALAAIDELVSAYTESSEGKVVFVYAEKFKRFYLRDFNRTLKAQDLPFHRIDETPEACTRVGGISIPSFGIAFHDVTPGEIEVSFHPPISYRDAHPYEENSNLLNTLNPPTYGTLYSYREPSIEELATLFKSPEIPGDHLRELLEHADKHYGQGTKVNIISLLRMLDFTNKDLGAHSVVQGFSITKPFKIYDETSTIKRNNIFSSDKIFYKEETLYRGSAHGFRFSSSPSDSSTDGVTFVVEWAEIPPPF